MSCSLFMVRTLMYVPLSASKCVSSERGTFILGAWTPTHQQSQNYKLQWRIGNRGMVVSLCLTVWS